MHTPLDYLTPVLRNKLERFEPLIFYVNDITGYRNSLKYKEGADGFDGLDFKIRLIGRSKVFEVRNPSSEDAAYSLVALASW